MKIRALTLFAAFAALSIGQGCECTPPAAPPGDAGTVGDCDEFDPDVDTDTTMTAECSPYILDDADLTVTNGATLTIEPGVEVRFDPDHWLEIYDGILVAEGTADDKIHLTSTDTDAPAAGSWLGVVLRGATGAGTSLRHVVIQGAGQEGSGTHSCLHIESTSVAQVAIDDSEVIDCGGAGLTVDGDGFELASFTNNTFTNMPAGLDVPPSVVDQIAASQTFTDVGENRIQDFPVVRTATWLGQPIPYRMLGNLIVGEVEGPVLTLAEGMTLRFSPGTSLDVGGAGVAGGLVAQGTSDAPVTFESAEPAPAPGSWHGVVFRPDTLSGSLLDYAVVRHAGEPAFMQNAGVTLFSAGNAVSITNTTFEDNATADIFVGCTSTFDGGTGNTTPSGIVTDGPC